MGNLKIYKDIPIPPRRSKHGKFAEAARRMEHKDSVMVKTSEVSQMTQQIRRLGMRAVQRRLDANTYRVWAVIEED